MRASRLLRAAVPAAAVALAALGALAGCSSKGTLKPNLPPETSLFVQGPVDTVNHVVHIYWFGTDVDGYVTRYELRFKNPALPADTQWVSTTRTDSVFTVYSPSGYVAPVFQVRAYDNDGAVDPTPAFEDFQFSNQAPTVTLQSPPGQADSTFASLTLTWIAGDIDGDPTKLRFLVWLDGNQANARSTTATTFTIPTADFLQAGQLQSGLRTVYVQAIDDGGRAGTPATATWFVRAPVSGTRARLLLIDDVPSRNGANFTTDTLYSNTAARNLAPDEYSILRLEFTQPFRSAEDVAQTFALFDAVVWYRGTQTSFSTVLRDYQDGIGTYLGNGGKFMIEGLNLFLGQNGDGPIFGDFVTKYLNSDGMMKAFDTTLQDSSVAWGIGNGRVLRSSVLQDSLRSAAIFSGLRGFAVRDTSDAVLVAPPGTLSQAQPAAVPVGVSVPQPGGGRCTVISIPLRGANGYFTAPRVLAKLFAQLGLTSP